MRRLGGLLALLALFLVTSAEDCDGGGMSAADRIQRQQQEQLMAESTSAVPLPAIKNFREKRLLKDIFELRDQAGLTTYTYVWNELAGRLVFFCDSIGYPVPYATQYTNPQKTIEGRTTGEFTAIPQADPNGLFSPAAAEGTWVMCKDPHGDAVRPVYVEPRVVVSPFKMGA